MTAPTSSPSGAARRPSAVDRLADGYVEDSIRLDPILATQLGAAGHDDRLPDYSPDGIAERADLNRRTLRELDGLAADADSLDAIDRVSVAAMQERLELDVARYEAGEHERSLNVIESPPQEIRLVFDVMRTGSTEDWTAVTARLRAVPAALDGYRRSLTVAAERGEVAARRQVDRVAAQCVQHAGDDGFFATFAGGATVDGAPLGGTQAGELAEAARDAAAAYGALAQYLRSDLLPIAPAADGVGRERYALGSQYFLGARVDLDETYEWGLAELARIEAEMAEVSDAIVPGGDLAAAVAALNADPDRRIEGKEAFRDWMQDLSDRTVAEMAATHFDIDESIRHVDCRIAPTTEGGIYYLPPSEDLSRPGSMWWSVPQDVTSFATWTEVTTVFHEGVPGHHLQCAQAALRADVLNRWRRSMCWVSGHGEGWALYAERLMAELGFLDDPGARLGMLDGQSLRAARVVLDIGVHLGKQRPAGSGPGTWDAGFAWEFLRSHSHMGEAMLRFELDRYLGWPGQAPSYKVGERIWLQLREEARARAGDAFDLREFHRQALDLGSLGLDVLREAMLGRV